MPRWEYYMGYTNLSPMSFSATVADGVLYICPSDGSLSAINIQQASARVLAPKWWLEQKWYAQAIEKGKKSQVSGVSRMKNDPNAVSRRRRNLIRWMQGALLAYFLWTAKKLYNDIISRGECQFQDGFPWHFFLEARWDELIHNVVWLPCLRPPGNLQ